MKKSIVPWAVAVLISAGLARAEMIINLPVVNHSFETDVGGTAQGATGWTLSAANAFKVTFGDAPDGANRLDARIANNPTTVYASQIIDISSYASNIALGGATATFIFYNMTNDMTNDSANGAIEFFNASNVSLGSTTTSWFKNSTWTASSIVDAAVPVDARSLKITLGARRTSASQTDVLIDNISVALTVIPEPATFGIMLSALAAAVIRRRRFG